MESLNTTRMGLGREMFDCESALIPDLVEVLSGSPHLLPSFIKQLDADTEELLPCSVMGEEHWVIIVAALIS